MKLILSIMFAVVTSVINAQIYSGYSPQGGTAVDPTVQITAGSTAVCTYAAAEQVSPTHPAGCNFQGDFGNYTLIQGQSRPMTQGGIGTLFCQGYIPNACTLEIVISGKSSHAPGPFPPNHTEGSAYGDLGGFQGGCEQFGLTIKPTGQIIAGVPASVTFDAPNLGHGFCISESDGSVNWGDGTVSNIPSVSVPGNDLCAKVGAKKLQFNSSTLSHTYQVAGSIQISAYMDLKLKEDTQPTIWEQIASKGQKKGRSGSWECVAKRWDQFNVTSTPHVEKITQYRCRVGKKAVACSPPPRQK